MSTHNYSLEVISHHPQFANKSLRKYSVNGIDTVGAWGDEPFEIKFTNHTWQKIQVKISVDGTDVFSGQPATTDVSDKMWVVNGYGTLSLKAWPEDNNGGAAFVFTHAGNSVAIHTHGDMSSRGIIAAAVFVEGHVEPVRVNPYAYPNPYTIIGGGTPIITTYPGTWYNTSGDMSFGSSSGTFGSSGDYLGNVVTQSNSAYTANNADTTKGATMDCFNLTDSDTSDASDHRIGERRSRKSMEKLVAVGAGQHVNQKITYVTGLIKPTFTETLRVKYLWWDDLVAALRQNNVPESHASGFPGDGPHTNINLGKTPRLPRGATFKRAEPAYQRV